MSRRSHYPDPSVLLPWLPLSFSQYCLINRSQFAPGLQPTQLNLTSHLNIRPCLLCHAKRSKFYCADCINRGEFCHSDPRLPDTLVEKQLRSKIQQQNLDVLAQKITVRHEEVKRAAVLREKIKLIKQRKKYYTYLINEKTANLKYLRDCVKKLRITNRQRFGQLPKFQHKVDQITKVNEDRQAKQREKRILCDEAAKILAALRRKYALDLIKHIFPVEEVFHKALLSSDVAENEELRITEGLADAMGTSFVNGHWIQASQSMQGLQYRIVAPLLPANGDYAAVINGSAQDEIGQANPAQSVSAGLMFASLLVLHLSNVFNIQLPRRIDHQLFSGRGLY